MPELPEVETTRQGISPHILGQTIRHVTLRHQQLRWPVDPTLPQRLPGQTLHRLTRRGKYLLFTLDHGTLLWHLGMSGSLRIVATPTNDTGTPPRKHDHIDIAFGDQNLLRFHDPRRFGAVIWTEQPPQQHKLLKHLGPEPLQAEFNSDYVFQRARKTRRPVKSWLMDSTIVVGVGNIYANEALFNAGIHPLTPAQQLSIAQCQRLTEHVKQILSYAITRGGTTLRDFVGSDGEPGYFAQELHVYGRGGQPCQRCGTRLTEQRLAQRSTVYCTHCQQ